MTSAREQSPLVSVVVATYERGDLIKATMDALLAQTYAPLEVVIVDQSSSNETQEVVERLSRQDPRVRYLRTADRGCSLSRNLGVAHARGGLVLVTDDDCLPSPDWAEAMVSAFDDGTVDAVVGRVRSNLSTSTPTDLAIRDDPTPKLYRSPISPWKVGHGANFGIRRDVFIALGGFDPVLGPGAALYACEDGDVIHRLLSTGHSISYCPDATVEHRQWRNWRQRRTTEKRYGTGAGAQAAKYFRLGDPMGRRLLATWIWEMGVRRTAAGLLKWRDMKVVWLGLCQLIVPWVGVARAQGYAVDHTDRVFVQSPLRAGLELGRAGADEARSIV